MSPPSDPGTVYLGPDESESNAQIRAMCKRLLPQWHGASTEDIAIMKISGGISNLIVKVQPSESHLYPVVLKVFGEKTELLVDRDQELRTLIKLNASGFGAQVRVSH